MKKRNRYFLIPTIAILVAAILVLSSCELGKITGKATDGQVKVDFYVMSQCPYGTQVEDAIKPVLDELRDGVDFNLDFIARASGRGKFQSLHGQPEVQGDIVQLCAAKYYPENHRYMDMVVCMNENARAIPGNWEGCAKRVRLNVEKIKECYEGDEGKQLLTESTKRANAAQARGSPTIYINDQPYGGGRDTLSFKKAICANLDHKACKDMPKCGSDTDCAAEPGKIGKCENPGTKDAKCSYTDPVKVELVVLNDKDCKTCDPSQMIRPLRQMFKGLAVRSIDVSSEEGQALVTGLGIKVVPSFIFDSQVTKTAVWEQDPRMRAAFEKAGNLFKIKDEATGASYYVDEETRIAQYEAKGVTLGDNRPQIDFFVMSYCPYGNQAEELIEPVYQLLKDSADFNPHYVIYPNYGDGGPNYCLDNGKYCSMHGIQELNQGVRELCVSKYLGMGEWFKFAMEMNKKCNYQNADTCWGPVAQGLGLDVEKIKVCERDEALALLADELKLNQAYGAQGSPQIFIDGDEFSGSRSSSGYLEALCAAFEHAPGACNTVIEETAAPAPTGSC